MMRYIEYQNLNEIWSSFQKKPVNKYISTAISFNYCRFLFVQGQVQAVFLKTAQENAYSITTLNQRPMLSTQQRNQLMMHFSESAITR